MPVSITYLGHSGFVFKAGAHGVAIDPFLTDNPLARHKPDDIVCQYIAITHGHFDHLGDTVVIAKRNNAKVIAAFELATMLEEQGVECEKMNPGGKITLPFGWVALTHAFHSSSNNGRYLANPCGVVLHLGGVTIYHCGDTGLFGDLKLFGEIYKPDIAMIPIGDRFTMGPELGSMAADFINPKVAIPVHYNTWPPIQQDPAKLRPRAAQVRVMRPGEVWEYDG